MAQTYTDYFAHLLAELIDQTINEESEIISRGQCADFSDYKFRAGGIAALRKCLDLIGETETIIITGERNR